MSKMQKSKDGKYKDNYQGNTDISICINGGCIMNRKCHRFQMKSNKPNQSYVKFEPLDDNEEDFECEKFISLKT